MAALRRWWPVALGPLGRRLAAGSLIVALLSIALVAGVILFVVDDAVDNASRGQESAAATAIVAAVRSAYLADADVKPVDVVAAGDLARAIGVGVEVRANGQQLLYVAAPTAGGSTRTLSVMAGGREVATATIIFPHDDILPVEAALRSSIGHAVAEASALAAVAALFAAILASHRVVAPVRSLTRAARRLGAGDHTSRVGEVGAPGELGELARAFDGMAADLERADALRRALVADLSHELRTPLAVLQAELEALSAGIVALDQDAVGSLAGEVGRLIGLVEDLSVLADADAAGLSLHKVRLDLAEIVALSAARLASRFAEGGVELSMNLAESELTGDRGRIEQVVVNLLTNAVKFTPPGGRVNVAVGSSGADRFLVVADTGDGIPEEDQPWVFDRFFRGAGSHDKPGSGIGLAVVASLVAAHGGRIELRSAPGAGSTFTVHFASA